MLNERRARVGVFLPKDMGWSQKVLEGISAYCQIKSHWKLVLACASELEVLANIGAHLDGVIAAISGAEVASGFKAWGKPCVDVYFNTPPGLFPQVNSDYRMDGRAGAEHLIGMGLPRFAFCAIKGYSFFRLRQQGFEERVRQAGASCFVYQIDGSTMDWSGIWKGIAEWVAALPKPIGLMAAKDCLAVEVLEACADLGIKVPDQVAVVGMGNDRALCERANPPLASVDPGIARIGFQAATLLDQMMSGKPVPKQRYPLPPPRVVSRATTEVYSLNDPQMTMVLRYIQEHACDPMQVNDLLGIVPLSRRSLELRFLQARGHSLHDEIRRIQLQRAAQLLAQTQLPLEKVAEASGFSSPKWLGNVFRKELGITPGEHRRRNGLLTTPMFA